MAVKNSAQAAQSITNFTNSRKGANDYLTDAYTKFGVTPAQERVGQMRTAVTNTQNLLDAVPDSVSGRTSGSLVSDAQRGRLVAMEQQPLAIQLNTQNQAYGNASEDYKNLLGEANTYSTNAYGADNDKLGALKSIYDILKGREDTAAQRRIEAQQARREEIRFQKQMALENKKFAEEQRQFNASLAQSAKQAAASSLSGLGLLGGGGSKSTKLSSNPDMAVKQLFAGYSPSKKGYTENVVIPRLSELLHNHQAAVNIAYQYRKMMYGE